MCKSASDAVIGSSGETKKAAVSGSLLSMRQ
jgi:hypothetical protein